MNINTPRTHFQWLTSQDVKEEWGPAFGGALERHSLPIPPELGHGQVSILHLTLGMTLFKATHEFLPAAGGQLISLGEVTLEYQQPCFLVQTIRGGQACHREFHPSLSYLFNEGRDLFGYASHRHVEPLVDGSSNTTMVGLAMHRTVLDSMLGEADSRELLDILGITEIQSFVVRAVPRAITNLLHGAFSPTLCGPAQSMYAQAKALEFLSRITEHFHPQLPTAVQTSLVRKKVMSLHLYLQELEGKLPTLAFLAKQFGMPARRLNAEFTAEFGVSIFNFIACNRLAQAREAISGSDIPLKVVADRLGYSHVNHFNNAFKKHFGYSPGRYRNEMRK